MILGISFEGFLGLLILGAVIGLINWIGRFMQRLKEDGSAAPRAGNSRTLRTEQNAEEERLRRYYEALGIPPDQRPPALVKPRPERSTASPLPNIQPRGTLVAGRAERKAKKSTPPPMPPARRAPTDAPSEGPALPVAKIHLKELQVPEVTEFHTTSSRIHAIPYESSSTELEDDAYSAKVEKPGAVDEVRSLLHSRNDLRHAFLLREILGPPRGLPSAFGLSNLDGL